ncbi:tetratricopeptide repeat protein, partial [Muriicola sp.]
MRLYLTISVLLISAFTLYGQGSMNEGFHLLDSGNFAGAEEFFDAYLREAPENKTALICYGRAVGLNGNPTKAISHFEALKEQYPGDLE